MRRDRPAGAALAFGRKWIWACPTGGASINQITVRNGNRAVKVVPCSFEEVTDKVPWCARTICEQMLKPNPNPSRLDPVARRQNGSKILDCMLSGIGSPALVTLKTN